MRAMEEVGLKKYRDESMPISPLEAISRLNEPVTFEMLVRWAKSCTGSLQFFLDSEENHRDPTNLGVPSLENWSVRQSVCFAQEVRLHLDSSWIAPPFRSPVKFLCLTGSKDSSPSLASCSRTDEPRFGFHPDCLPLVGSVLAGLEFSGRRRFGTYSKKGLAWFCPDLFPPAAS